MSALEAKQREEADRRLDAVSAQIEASRKAAKALGRRLADVNAKDGTNE